LGLRDLVEKDLAATLEDDLIGFGWPITIRDPNGNEETLKGYSNDVSNVIDPETGQAISGRIAQVTLRNSTLAESSLVLPIQGIVDEARKPWRVTFTDLAAAPTVFKVIEAMPDRAMGISLLRLELYNGS